MITCCANQECSTGYRDSSGGNMYSVNTLQGLEFFWLCPRCAPLYHLSFDSVKRVHIRSRPETGRMCLVQLPQNRNETYATF
jgi:hypothetical protein